MFNRSINLPYYINAPLPLYVPHLTESPVHTHARAFTLYRFAKQFNVLTSLMKQIYDSTVQRLMYCQKFNELNDFLFGVG